MVRRRLLPGHAACGSSGPPAGALSPMRQLYLHAGLPKTGTTFLQALLLRNRAALEAAGFGFGPHMNPRPARTCRASSTRSRRVAPQR